MAIKLAAISAARASLNYLWDKREDKRANKQKATQRNRRYEKRLLHHLREATEE